MHDRHRHLMTVQPVERVLRRVLLLRPMPEWWARVVPPVQPVERLPGRPKVVPLQAVQLRGLLLAERPSSCRLSQMALRRHNGESTIWSKPVRKEHTHEHDRCN